MRCLISSNCCKSPRQSKQVGSFAPPITLGPVLDPTVALRSEQATEHFAPSPGSPIPQTPVLKVTASLFPWKMKLLGPDVWQNLEDIIYKALEIPIWNALPLVSKGKEVLGPSACTLLIWHFENWARYNQRGAGGVPLERLKITQMPHSGRSLP